MAELPETRKENVPPRLDEDHASITGKAAAQSDPLSSPFPSISRKRPLRTYGKRKRIVEDAEPEPVAKRQKAAVEKDGPGKEEIVLPPLPKISSPIRTGIMKYFKPTPVTSSSTPSTPRSGSMAVMSTPPSSPPFLAKQRPRQGPSARGGREDALQDRLRIIDSQSSELAGLAPKQSRGSQSPDRYSDDAESDQGHVLLESNTNARNRQGLKPGRIKKKNVKNTGKLPSIQTTLSLSSKTAFTECKECNILYNSLNEKDIKYHARRHASICRRATS